MKTQLYVIVSLLMLSACATTQIHSYNSALVEFYETRSRAEADQQWTQYETATAGLENLATEAEQAADKESTALNKISLYRVAATAAWQSERDADVLRITDKGNKLCAENNNAESAPRDCAMLDVIPLLAALDDAARRYELLIAAVKETPKEDWETKHGPATVEIFADLERGLSDILTKRERTKTLKVSDGYRKIMDKNIGIAVENLNEAYQLLRRAHALDPEDGSADPAEKDATCRLLALKAKLKSDQFQDAADKLMPAQVEGCPAA
jgi:hypothetical protein